MPEQQGKGVFVNFKWDIPSRRTRGGRANRAQSPLSGAAGDLRRTKGMEDFRREAEVIVSEHKAMLEGISDFIFSHPELGDEEFESSKYLVELLRAQGFSVEFPYKGVETAFRAEFGDAEGPKIGFLAEYDALPGYGSEKKPAHACGHNWIAASKIGRAHV
jgi:hypothetical protein